MEVSPLMAAFIANGLLHAIHYVKRIKIGWCSTTGPEEDGTYYVPTWTFDGRTRNSDVVVCMKCSAALCALVEER